MQPLKCIEISIVARTALIKKHQVQLGWLLSTNLLLGDVSRNARQAQLTRQSREEVEDLDDLAAAWKEAGETGRAWGGRGFGGRGWLRNGQVESARDIILYNMSLSYGGKELIKEYGEAARSGGQTLKLIRGHRYGFLGNNGCGKTTLLRRFHNGTMPGFPRHMSTLLVGQVWQPFTYLPT